MNGVDCSDKTCLVEVNVHALQLEIGGAVVPEMVSPMSDARKVEAKHTLPSHQGHVRRR